jgi:hypothetical protein
MTKTPTVDRHPSTSAGHSRPLDHKHLPFSGLLVMVGVYLAVGVTLWVVLRNSDFARFCVAFGILVLTVALANFAALLSRTTSTTSSPRQIIIRWHLTSTIVLIGVGEAITVIVGPNRWWMLVFLLNGVCLAASWALYRLDSLRRDPSQSAQPTDDGLTKKLGLEGVQFGKPKHVVDENGDLARIEVEVKHAPGETAEPIQAAVPGIESLADHALAQPVPAGRSRVVPTGGAGTSKLTIITKDVLTAKVLWPGPSAPGGCITAPLRHGVYEDQYPLVKYIAGGHDHAPNPASYGYMGMTRTGKTMDALICVMEMFSRRNVVITWVDTVKGAQTVKPIRNGLDIIVVSNDPKVFKAAMRAACKIVDWRASELGKHGYREWIPECALDPKLRMPAWVWHFEECDVLTDIAGDEMVYLASKGLSAGVIGGYSLQRADAQGMPTNLRFNIGNWSVFGCGDDYSADFALSGSTRAAGASPENWGQAKPGYAYHEGVGIPDEKWPVVAKTFFAEAPEMEAYTNTWASQMMRPDAGSIAAGGDWYTNAKKATLEKVAEWDAATDVIDMSIAEEPAMVDSREDLERYGDMTQDEEIEDMRRTGEIDIDPEAATIDISVPIPPPAPDSIELPIDEKPEAKTREDALAAFRQALAEMASDDSLPDGENGGVAFSVKDILARYSFRSRPWFSETLTAIVDGDVELDGIVLTRTDKPGMYELQLAD